MRICITNTTMVLFIIAAVAKMFPALWSVAQVKGQKTLIADLVAPFPPLLHMHWLWCWKREEATTGEKTNLRTQIRGHCYVKTRDGFYVLSEKSIMHVMKSSLSGFLCSYVCATVFEWHRGVSLSAVPRSRGPALVVFLGGHTHLRCFISLSPLCFKPAHTKNK